MNTLTLHGKIYEISDDSSVCLSAYVMALGLKEVKETSGRWKPLLREPYYWLDSSGYCSNVRNGDDHIDCWNIASGNCYRTEAEAKKAHDYALALQEIKDSSDFVPDWSNIDQQKHSVSYDFIEKRLRVGCCSWIKETTLPMFANSDDACTSIDAHRKAWLTVFGVEE